MPFYVKYVKNENTVVKELPDCANRKQAVEQLDEFRKLSDDGKVSLTSQEFIYNQWQKWIKDEQQITPSSSKER
jgi:hypothetical protein